MNKKVEIKSEVRVRDIAMMFAKSSDEDQAELLNVLFKALKRNCDSAFSFDMQLASIGVLLTDESKTALRYMGASNVQ